VLRAELADDEWLLIAPLLPPERGRPGRPSHDNRRVLEGIFWAVRSGARWVDVPERFGRWNSVYRRYRRWAEAGVFEALLSALAGALASERLQMIDSTVVRAHAQAAGKKVTRRSAARVAASRPSSTSGQTRSGVRSISALPQARRTT
jgi:transposase